jgi:hypothetical protein
LPPLTSRLSSVSSKRSSPLQTTSAYQSSPRTVADVVSKRRLKAVCASSRTTP